MAQSTSGILTSSNLAQVEYNTKHAYYNLHERKTYKHKPEVSPFGIALVKKKWQIKLGDAGTFDCFGLAFQYQITQNKTKNGQKLGVLRPWINTNSLSCNQYECHI